MTEAEIRELQANDMAAQIAALQANLVARDERIATLEKANADLHSRLDELRRVFGRNSIPGGGQHVGASAQARLQEAELRRATNDETASDRLAEQAAKLWPSGGLTPDPPPS